MKFRTREGRASGWGSGTASNAGQKQKAAVNRATGHKSNKGGIVQMLIFHLTLAALILGVLFFIFIKAKTAKIEDLRKYKKGLISGKIKVEDEFKEE